jgi:hypothetical protein
MPMIPTNITQTNNLPMGPSQNWKIMYSLSLWPSHAPSYLSDWEFGIWGRFHTFQLRYVTARVQMIP